MSKLIRVQCTLPNASHSIGGTLFGGVPNADPNALKVRISEPLEPDAAERYLRIPGFAVFAPEQHPADVLAQIDAEIAEHRAAAGAAQVAEAGGAMKQQLVEAQRANEALALELKQTREQLLEAQRAHLPVDQRLAGMTAELERLQKENQDLRQANTTLAGERPAPRNKPPRGQDALAAAN
jgi:hypothetical protein